MHRVSNILFIGCLTLFSTLHFSHAESFWEKTKSAISDTVDTLSSEETKQDAAILWNKTKTAVTDTGTEVGKTADHLIHRDKNISIEEHRLRIDTNSEQALSDLFAVSTEAQALYSNATGYAIFDSREFAFLIKTGFGTGVAVNKSTRERTYMKMASAGLNLGGGIKYLHVIFIFPTEQTFNDFITKGWNAEGDASVVGGDDSAQLGLTLANGTKVYQVIDTGIMLKMSISGTKYWKDSALN